MQEGIDFVRCRVCGMESGSLARHLSKHNMKAADYKAAYPYAKVVADKVRDERAKKLRAKPKKEQRLVCQYCNGIVGGRVQRCQHEKKERDVYLRGKEGEDYIVCRECGYRSPMLSQHLKLHEMTKESYRAKWPDAPIVLSSTVSTQKASNIGKHSKACGEHNDSVKCEKCGEAYRQRQHRYHWQKCVVENIDNYVEGEEYVRCPECEKPMLRLGVHLRQVHDWTNDRVQMSANEGLQLMASCVVNKWREKQDFKKAQEKREQTHLKRHGHKNPFSSPEVQEKIKETSRRRYGHDHAMQSEDIRIKQNESAQTGPSGQEVFFDEHTCDSVVYTGYGGRFIRCKEGVEKYGRIIKDLNPDFMVFPDNVLQSAMSRSKERKKLSSEKHRTKYVVELLGDYYHSEEVIGVPAERHEREVLAAYASAGIECLVLWEHDVLDRWDEIQSEVEEWIQMAVKGINESPVWRKATKDKV